MYYFNGSEEWEVSLEYSYFGFNILNKTGFRITGTDGIKTNSNLALNVTGGNKDNGYVAFCMQFKNLPEGLKDKINSLPTAAEKRAEWIAYLSRNPFYAVFKRKGEIVNGSYTTLDYSSDFVFYDRYPVWDKGVEQVVTPRDDDNKTCYNYGANATIENEYYVYTEVE